MSNGILLALLIGGVVGGASSLFAGCLGWVTQFRTDQPVVVLLLPFGGLLIVFLYQKIGKEDRGTTQVLSTIRSQDEVPLRSAPLIFIATALTHLLGGSAGREGAAIQLGGSIGNQLGRWIHLDEEDRHVIVMCGMSAAFSAVFGTPMAAAVFAMEVVSVGVMYYAALLPCVVASLVAYDFAGSFGIHPENFHVTGIPAFSMENGIKMGIIAVGCGAVSILFCLLLEYVSKGYDKWLKNPYLRVFAVGCLVVVLYWILGTDRYMGAGNQLIEQAVEHGQTQTFDFFWKMLLTGTDDACRFPRGRDRSFVCHRRHLWLSGRTGHGILPVVKCSSRDDRRILRRDELPGYFYINSLRTVRLPGRFVLSAGYGGQLCSVRILRTV